MKLKNKTTNINKMKIRTLNIFILGITLISTISSCGNKTAADEDGQIIVQRKVKSDSTDGLAIAYYVQDSIATGFNFYRSIDSMLRAEEKEFERQLRSRYENYQAYENKIRQRMEAGEITGYQLDEIQEEAMRKQESIANFERQRGGELQRESIKYQTALMNKISEAGREFSEKNGIDMLFFYQKGGQITYISNAFDVTEQFIKFLNNREKEIKEDFDADLDAVDTNQDQMGLNL